jgi:hypothetical protein
MNSDEKRLFDAYRRMEIALGDGWQIISRIEEGLATADDLRHQWQAATSGLIREASSLVNVVRERGTGADGKDHAD